MDDSRPSQDDDFGFDDYKNYENAAESECTDRFSELPDFLILNVLSLLPMCDVVRTTILSKRWQDLWTTVPCLIFEDDNDYAVDYKPEIFVKFVNSALELWKGSKIQKFAIISMLGNSLRGCLDKWLAVALKYEVEELHMNLEVELIVNYDVSSYFPPQQLYPCSSMRKLTLVGCRMEISGNVHWDKLKSLTIGGVVLEEHVVDQVLSGCPVLEILNLRLWESKNHLNLHSASLKKLKIEKSLEYDCYAAKDTTLTIWAPNVDILEMSGAMYCKYLLKNVSSLNNVTLAFSNENWNFSYEYYDIDNDGEIYKSRNETLMQVFQSIRHVEYFTLSDWCIQALEEVRDYLSILPSDAKYLKLWVGHVDKPKIVNTLKMFPKLTMLVLEDAKLWTCDVENPYEKEKCVVDPYVLKFDEENLLKSKKKSRLLHLRTVEINWIANDSSMIYLIEILQKYASKLEKMVIRPIVIKRLPPQSLFFGSPRN